MSRSPTSPFGSIERAVFAQLRRAPASRAELAKATGLSAPTVGKAADALVEAGLLEEYQETRSNGESRAEGSIGRPARPLRLNRSQSRLIALQLGVNRTRLAALPVSGPLGDAWAIEFRTPRTAKAWAARLRAAAKRLPVSEPWGVMVSVPGVVDEDAGNVLLSPNLHWTEHTRLPELIGRIWEAPVCLVQEIRALALGHAAAVPGHRDFLLVDFGAGVGGAAVLNGRLHPSALPLSGELGHTPVIGNDRLCGCGAVGCLETLLSRWGLTRSFSSVETRIYRATPEQVLANTKGCIARRIANHGIEPWLASSLDAAAATIAGALNVLGLNRVVITGALTEFPSAVFTYLSGAIERSAMWARFGRIECVAAPRRRAAGLVAAAVDRVLLPEHGDARRGVGRRFTG